ncbi:Zn-ribbon domain-containing OB-fold protein [Mycobacterium vicinigordonae]|uniref:OB-fold domain-containing protein n=1 Tax=Mycobacterium vicinigordonae TaxID=1719132 RepID=A0A7D6HTG1_9MYCO|nr:OB-fold domain-containing protein [Mycobacterium vicinigordonae]QLL06233.1 OB-fold domain-containing protein [Mycobacterium vicinigordonae]
MAVESNWNVEVPLVGAGIFSVDPPALLGATCRTCAQMCFPAAPRCPYCRGAHMEVVQLPSVGTIYSYTISHIRGPGYLGPVPYGLGVIEFDTGIRVATLLSADPLERLRIGARARIALADVGAPEQPLLSYTHTLVE